MEPWLIHPDLTEERLVAVARLIAKGRNDALDRYEPEIGDNGWTLGTRAFQFGRHQILMGAESGEYPWLQIVDGSLRLIFQIGEVPVRFYKGIADEPTDRTLRQSFPELRQLSFIFPHDADASDFLFRFAVETGLDGEITSIKFVALREEEPVHVWDVPLAHSVTTLYPLGSTSAGGVELPPPHVGLPEDEAAEDSKAG